MFWILWKILDSSFTVHWILQVLWLECLVILEYICVPAACVWSGKVMFLVTPHVLCVELLSYNISLGWRFDVKSDIDAVVNKNYCIITMCKRDPLMAVFSLCFRWMVGLTMPVTTPRSWYPGTGLMSKWFIDTCVNILKGCLGKLWRSEDQKSKWKLHFHAKLEFL